MLEDRHYMRGSPYYAARNATLTLLIINVAVFLVQSVLARFSNFPTQYYFALSLEGLRHGFVWQFLSYQFMHGNLLHLVVNLWAIYVFGNEVESALGRRSFLLLYLGSGILGGVFQALAGLIFGSAFAAPVVGASAAAFGLAAAFALLFPDRLLLLFFIIPIRAKYLLVICGLLTVYGLMFPEGNIAHAAHLGGILAGIFYVQYTTRWTWQWPRFRFARSSPKLVKVSSRQSGGWARTRPAAVEDDLPAAEFLSKEVDPILDKISASGIHSLTERERRILEKARAKMAGR
jgi:membrane associated rhomboid family serine protease